MDPLPNGVSGKVEDARSKLKEANTHTQTVKAAATWKQVYGQAQNKMFSEYQQTQSSSPGPVRSKKSALTDQNNVRATHFTPTFRIRN